MKPDISKPRPGTYNRLLLRNTLFALLTLLLLTAMGIAVDGGFSVRHSMIALVLTGCSFIIHLKSFRRKTSRTDSQKDLTGDQSSQKSLAAEQSHIRRQFTSIPGKSRDLRLDYLRLLAVVGVITIHAVDGLFPFITAGADTAFASMQAALSPAAAKADAVIRTCCLGFNIVYIMLSGALLLEWREESLRDFYLKRVSKVLLPLIIFFFFYEWQNAVLFPLTAAKLADIIRKFFTADIDYCPFYWLIYVILSLYLIYPFMRYMLRELPYRSLTVLSFGIIAFSGTVAYTRFVFAPVIGYWLGYAILGYWITRPESRRFDKFLLPLGLLQIGVIAYLILRAERYEDYIGQIVQYTPVMVFLCLGYFSFVYLLPRGLVRDSRFLRFFGKYSYSCILVHWWTLYFILGKYYPGYNLDPSALSPKKYLFYRLFASGGWLHTGLSAVQNSLGLQFGLLYLVIADVLLSLAVGALLEEYLLTPLLYLWDKITAYLR